MIVLLVFASHVQADNVATGSSKDLRDRMVGVSDEVTWTSTQIGLSEGVKLNGEVVRAFRGKEGVGIVLSEKRRDLRHAISSGDEGRSKNLTRLVDDLEWVYELSAPIDQHLVATKALQEIEVGSYFPTVCGHITVAQSTFKSNAWMMWDHPIVTASSPGFGTGIQPGPWAPPPNSTFRSLYVELGQPSSSTIYTDYASSTAKSTPIHASAENWGMYQCYMETVHLVSANCESLHESAVVTIEQKCENVWYDIPPVITTD